MWYEGGYVYGYGSIDVFEKFPILILSSFSGTPSSLSPSLFLLASFPCDFGFLSSPGSVTKSSPGRDNGR